MSWLEALVLGIVQGLTEFLPISSSAHQSIVGQLFGGVDPGSAFTAITQLGTEAAVIIYFRHDIGKIIRHWSLSLVGKMDRNDPEARMGWLVILGSIPIVVLGVLFQDAIDSTLRNLWTTAAMLAGFGIVIGVVDHFARNSRPLESLTWKHGIIFGLAQSLALIPGVSRSGATITAGLAMGYQRVAAARYSFLLAIPAVRRVGILQAGRRVQRPGAAGLGSDRPGDRGGLRHRLCGDRLAAALHQHAQLPAVRDLPPRPGGPRGDLAVDRRAVAAPAELITAGLRPR